MKHEPKPPRRKLRDLGPIIRRRPAVFAVYLVLRLIVIAVLVSSILRREYESAFICLLVLVLFMLPFFIQQNFGIEPDETLLMPERVAEATLRTLLTDCTGQVIDVRRPAAGK